MVVNPPPYKEWAGCYCYWAGCYCLTIRRYLYRRLRWLTHLHTWSGRGLNGCSRNALSTTTPLCFITTPLTKHLNAQYRRLSQVSHAPLEFPECRSMTTGGGEVSSRDSMKANMQRHKSQRGRLFFTSSPPFIAPLSSGFCLLKLFVRGGTKKDMGVKSAIELYNPVLSFSAFFHRG